MGAVFRARSPSGRAVAIKLLLKQVSSAQTLARFDRERRMLALLDERSEGAGEGFVPLLDVGDGPHGPYLVMPFIEGGTLRERLSRGPLAVEDTIAVGRALARAIGRAHALGIVHRDLKPENVLFTGEGRPLIADLGLAKHFLRGPEGAAQSASLSAHGEMRGTAAYMSPEQTKDAKTAAAPADVFALGAILHECLAGEPAFHGEHILEILTRINEGRVTPVRRLRPETPRWLEAVISRALATDARARYADGSALALALEAGERGVRARGALVVLGLVALVVVSVASALAVSRLGRGEETGPRGDAASVRSSADPALAARRAEARRLAASAVERCLACSFDESYAQAARAVELDPTLALA
ncbi:serine/threonine protein kinase, partial [bacterium]|nr:serine/threonine protein kinase [bacterium]